MPIDRNHIIRFRRGYKPRVIPISAVTCEACGSIVGDEDAHDRWHRSVAAVGHIANRADARSAEEMSPMVREEGS